MNRQELEARVRGGEVISRVDLSGADLTGASLGGGIFEAVSLRGARLASCSASGGLSLRSRCTAISHSMRRPSCAYATPAPKTASGNCGLRCSACS